MWLFDISFLTGAVLLPKGHLAAYGDIFWWPAWERGGRLLQASRGKRLGIMLNFLPCTGPAATPRKKYRSC